MFASFSDGCLCTQETGDPGAELWLADIQEGVRQANQDTQTALKSKSTQNLAGPSLIALRPETINLFVWCGRDHLSSLAVNDICVLFSVVGSGGSQPGSQRGQSVPNAASCSSTRGGAAECGP